MQQVLQQVAGVKKDLTGRTDAAARELLTLLLSQAWPTLETQKN